MTSTRSTYFDGQGAANAASPGRPVVWVSLRDPSPEELAAVQQEFGLPAPLPEVLATAARRPVLEVLGQVMWAVIKTASWVASEERARIG
jgi:magnesium transporter